VAATQRVRVRLGPRSYDVHIGWEILPELGRAMAALGLGPRALIVADGNVADSHAPLCASALHAAGLQTHLVVVPPGEGSKTLRGAERLYDACLDCGLDRSSCIVALGGGVVGDLAGFVAATYMRGVDFVQVPTTLLAQIDASVGGKVAVDHPRGKNLIGAFHQPRLVWCDVRLLHTLPAAEFAAGMAEAVKHGILGSPRYYAFVRRHHAELLAHRPEALIRLVAGSVRIKAAVVAADERERWVPPAAASQGRPRSRMVLNLGHTLAHALEAVAGFGALRHGEAVAIGLVAAGRLALGRGLWSPRWQAELEQTLQALRLPVRIPGLPLAELLAAMRVDKKAVGGVLRYILPVRPGEVAICEDVRPEELAAVLTGMGAAA
jgi:3-dehydroquinate synthase